MKRLQGSARECRANPKGIPCLYLSSVMRTAAAEVRPWIGTYVTLAKFRVKDDAAIAVVALHSMLTAFGSRDYRTRESDKANQRQDGVAFCNFGSGGIIQQDFYHGS